MAGLLNALAPKKAKQSIMTCESLQQHEVRAMILLHCTMMFDRCGKHSSSECIDAKMFDDSPWAKTNENLQGQVSAEGPMSDMVENMEYSPRVPH